MKIIKIGALWCSGCLVMKPIWKKVEEKRPGLVTKYYDVDNDTDSIKQYNIALERMPVFIFLDKEDKELTRVTGEVSQKTLLDLIDKYKDQ